MARGRIEKLGMADLLIEHKQWEDQADVIDDIDVVFGDSEDSSDDELEKRSESSLIQEMCLDTDSSHVREDVENLSKNQLITSDLKDKLDTLHRHLTKTSTSNTISTYGPIQAPEFPDMCSEPPRKNLHCFLENRS